ncbi:LA2681 family HEPN domain-containing protein [Vagococcus lutrae]|uniref:LA2681 family HEPN domain-containing protein n=1 Tax=Vagococcus lutrae TaxID=81947 RepID=UPI003D168A2A
MYSLFDKTAFFLNEYFDLGIKERDITFRSICKSDKKGRCGYSYKNTLPYQKIHALKAIY